jgi:hypothetical protein
MLMNAVIAAYCALVALMFTAAIVVVSVHDMHASRLKALDNAYLAVPWEKGEKAVKFVPLFFATVFMLLAIVLTLSLAACTTMQEAVTGGAAGGVAGFALAGPIGAGVGGAGGAIMTPMMAR